MQVLDQLFLDLQDALAGEYSLERELGRGGMGVVYLAREVALDRLVAIKVLPRERASLADMRERFLREARTAAQLFHPNIVPIYRVGEAAGLPYFVMAYVDGETLGERLRGRGPVMASTMTDILRDVTQALGYAHGRGVVHRDVKPDNILLERESGRALVSDFGIASRIDHDTNQMALAGTAQFMSPEQMQGLALDGRADLYSLGLVAFLALSGKLPFDRDASLVSTSHRVSVAPRSLAAIAPELPSALVHVVDKCLMQDISRRWASAEALLSALEPNRPLRAEIPVALREWARPSWLVSALPVWAVGQVAISAFAGFSALGQVAANLYAGGTPLIRVLVTALPLLPLTVIRLRQTRAVLRAGHSLNDLLLALRKHDASREVSNADAEAHSERRSHRLIRLVTLTSLSVATLAIVVVYLWGYGTNTGKLNTNLPLLFPRREFLDVFIAVTKWAFTIAASGSIVLGTLGAHVISPPLQHRLFGSLRERFWKSRAGNFLVAALTPKSRALLSADFRPTEMAVAVAAEELFAALPTAYRESLAEVPSVVARLTERAGVLRERVDELSTLMRHEGAAGEEALGDSVNHARMGLSETVTALERIRLDLLRLHGGLADLRPITSALNAAEQVGAHVDRLRSAQREMGQGRFPQIDLRTPTPA